MRLLEELVSVSRELAAAVATGALEAARRLAVQRQALLAAVESAAARLDRRRLASALLDALQAVEPAIGRCRTEVERLRGQQRALADQARAMRAYLTGAPWRSA